MTTFSLTAHERLEVLTSTPELLALECTWTAGGSAPPPHYHPAQEERFEVREGALRVVTDGRERVYGAGETFQIPPGTSHSIAAAAEHCRALWEVRLETEGFFRAMDRAGGRRLGQLVAIANHRSEIRLSGVPDPVQRVAFAMVRTFGSGLGRRR